MAKKKTTIYLDQELAEQLDRLANIRRRKVSAEIEILVENEVKAAFSSGELSSSNETPQQGLELMDSAVIICQAYADTNDRTVSTSFIARTATALSIDAQTLIKRCSEAGLTPRKNGNGTPAKVEVTS